jgi:hypothetical protein
VDRIGCDILREMENFYQYEGMHISYWGDSCTITYAGNIQLEPMWVSPYWQRIARQVAAIAMRDCGFVVTARMTVESDREDAHVFVSGRFAQFVPARRYARVPDRG